jgi:hypothetical protein
MPSTIRTFTVAGLVALTASACSSPYYQGMNLTHLYPAHQAVMDEEAEAMRRSHAFDHYDSNGNSTTPPAEPGGSNSAITGQ